jgi:cytochrome c peroxidase
MNEVTLRQSGRVTRLLSIAVLLALTYAPELGLAGAGTALPPDLRVPIGLDRYVPVPPDNPITAQKAALGRRLFFDTRLSGDGRTSCATCHQPERRFTDGRSVARGVFDREGRRNTPSILNRVYGRSAFWDGRASTLEDQVRVALTGDRDLGLSMEEAVARVSRDPGYARAFRTAFGEPVNASRIAQAVATFVRTRLSGSSAFDRFLTGETRALGTRERRGLELFTGRARCARCHAGPLLSDEDFHNTGVAWRDGGFQDAGRAAVTGSDRDRGAFKTPSLREVARTAPYMHDGSVASLADVIEFYDRGGTPNPSLDPDIRPLHLSAAEKAAIIAFLRSLSGIPVD